MVGRVASFAGVNVQGPQRTMDEAEAIVRPMLGNRAGYEGHLELVGDDRG
jgi:hypothetical protein